MAYSQLSYPVVPDFTWAACWGLGLRQHYKRKCWWNGFSLRTSCKKKNEWMNEIPTVPIQYLAKPQPRVTFTVTQYLIFYLAFDRSTQHLWIGNDIYTIAKPVTFTRLQSQCYIGSSGRFWSCLSFFLSFLIGSLTIIQWLSCSDCKRKVKTKC